MNFLQTKLNEMKKRKEEGNKGFSLVELIIVIAIMAILVGIVGTQVIPYINKSKESKDYQIINSYSTAATTAYGTFAEKVGSTDTEVNVYKVDYTTSPQKELQAEIKKLTGYDQLSDLTGKMKSKTGGTIKGIKISFNVSTKKIITQAYSDEACTTGKEVFEAVEAEL